jgi:hypothetical protein
LLARTPGSRHRDSPGVCRLPSWPFLCRHRCNRRRRSWPQLRATLKVESGARFWPHCWRPAPPGRCAESAGGVGARGAGLPAGNLAMNVKTRGKTLVRSGRRALALCAVQRVCFRLAGGAARNLKGVPHAPMEARPIVEDVCDRLRSDPKTTRCYIERAEAIETELNLVPVCGPLTTWACAIPSHLRSGLFCARPSRASLTAIRMPPAVCWRATKDRCGWARAKARRSGSWCAPAEPGGSLRRLRAPVARPRARRPT